MTVTGREIQSDIARATRQEWLLTNGIGGFAGSTIPCINTRRYHGILVAAQRPPVERLVLVSRLEETLIIDRREFSLSTCVHAEDIKNPAGYLHLERFERDPLPTWYDGRRIVAWEGAVIDWIDAANERAIGLDELAA